MRRNNGRRARRAGAVRVTTQRSRIQRYQARCMILERKGIPVIPFFCLVAGGKMINSVRCLALAEGRSRLDSAVAGWFLFGFRPSRGSIEMPSLPRPNYDWPLLSDAPSSPFADRCQPGTAAGDGFPVARPSCPGEPPIKWRRRAPQNPVEFENRACFCLGVFASSGQQLGRLLHATTRDAGRNEESIRESSIGAFGSSFLLSRITSGPLHAWFSQPGSRSLPDNLPFTIRCSPFSFRAGAVEPHRRGSDADPVQGRRAGGINCLPGFERNTRHAYHKKREQKMSNSRNKSGV